MGLKRRSSLLCRRINSIHQGRGYQHVPLCPTTAEICTDECCAYTCVLNHQMPFPARTHISNSQPSPCKLLKALLLQNASHPTTTKDVHSPWALLEETTPVQDTTALLLALHLHQILIKPQALASHLNCHTLLTSYSSETWGKPLFHGSPPADPWGWGQPAPTV